MTEPLTSYLGKPASALLMSAPFKSWPFERSIEDNLPDRLIDYVFPEHGLEMTCGNDDRIQSIFLEADSFDQALIDIAFSSNRRKVLGFLGVPSKSGAPHINPILGEFGAWDRFIRPDYAIHIQYEVHADRIKKITLMRPDVVP